MEDGVLRVTAQVHIELVHWDVHHVLDVIFGQSLVHFEVVLEVAFHLYFVFSLAVELIFPFCAVGLKVHLSFELAEKWRQFLCFYC